MNYKVGRAKHPLKLMLLGGISNRGPTPLILFEGKLDSIDLLKIFNKNIKPFLTKVWPDGHRLIMDNDPKHTSKLTQNWLKNNNVHHWKTPPQSPDLNLIELVWHELKTYVRSQKPTTKELLCQTICYFWNEILTPEKCQTYINHLPKVLPHVIIQRGLATRF